MVKMGPPALRIRGGEAGKASIRNSNVPTRDAARVILGRSISIDIN
jgi:hypothetical protein